MLVVSCTGKPPFYFYEYANSYRMPLSLRLSSSLCPGVFAFSAKALAVVKLKAVCGMSSYYHKLPQKFAQSQTCGTRTVPRAIPSTSLACSTPAAQPAAAASLAPARGSPISAGCDAWHFASVRMASQAPAKVFQPRSGSPAASARTKHQQAKQTTAVEQSVRL